MPIRINPSLILLMLVCTLNHVFFPSEAIEVLPLIVCAIATGLIYYADKTVIKRLTFLLYIIVSCILPTHIAFMPVILFAYYENENRMFSLLAAIPFLFHFERLMNIQNNLYITLVLSMMAILLKIQQEVQMRYKRDLTENGDAMRELTMNLNEKNRLLMAHQDDAIQLATLNERNRIAREIHDHVGHQLTRVLLQIGAQLTLKPSDPALLSMKDSLDSAMDNLRNSVHDLHDTSIDLESQLKQLCAHFDTCPVHIQNHVISMPPAKTKYALIAILKEGLSNITKHSNATQVNVSLVEHPSFYQFIIRDNGNTFSTDNPIDVIRDHGIGLQNIEQRVSELSGRFLVRTKNGFELFITIPKQPPSQNS